VVETPKLVHEVLAGDLSVEHVFVRAGSPVGRDLDAVCAPMGVPVYQLFADTFDKLADAQTPQPAMAVVEAPVLDFDHRFSDDPGGLLVLVDVNDPGNVGTLIRTAEAAGCTGVVVAGETVDVLSPKVVRASAGSILRVPLAEMDAEWLITALHGAGYRAYGTAMSGDDYSEVPAEGGVAWLLGSEAHGLRSELAAAVDGTVSIPMAGTVESLNVATAGAVLAFDHALRRNP
jgi:TrmH family RNA methyltransferase